MAHQHVAYNDDLAHIHDQGFGDFARGAAPGILRLLRQSGIHDGLVIDIGCGSGIWAAELLRAGYQVLGIDLSPAMIELARQRAPLANFQVGSLYELELPACRAVTALGEVLNYQLDADHSWPSLSRWCRRVFDALSPGGLLIFDIAGPGRCRGQTQRFWEGTDWTCLVEYQHDEANRQVARRIITFREVEGVYRRCEEVHRQQLYRESEIADMLRQIGFEVQTVTSYGDAPLPEAVVGLVAAKH